MKNKKIIRKIIGSENSENIYAWSPSCVGQKCHWIFLQNEKWFFLKWKQKNYDKIYGLRKFWKYSCMIPFICRSKVTLDFSTKWKMIFFLNEKKNIPKYYWLRKFWKYSCMIPFICRSKATRDFSAKWKMNFKKWKTKKIIRKIIG